MRYTYIHPFVDSAREVLSEFVVDPVVAGEIELSATPVTSRGITAIVGVTGEGVGRVLFDLAQETALRLASTMNGESMIDFNQLAKDSISELASMMAGKAISTLNDQGHRLQISPPTLFQGENVTISHPQLETLVVPLDTTFGQLIVNVAIATS